MTLFNINGLAQKKQKQTKVLISTSHGDIKLVLYNETPKHRDNFIKLVKEGFYDETLFHRVIAGFMIQGGDPDSKNAEKGIELGNGGPGYKILAEFDTTLIHQRGALAAARQGRGNPKKKSSGSQFYIVQGAKFKKVKENVFIKVGDENGREITTKGKYTDEHYKIYETIGGTPQLDMEYTVFGQVIEGMDIIDKIAVVSKDMQNRPIKNIKMTMKIVKK